MITLRFRSHLLKLYPDSIFLLTFSRLHTETSPSIKSLKNPIFCNYLINTLNFPEDRAIEISNRLRFISSVEQPQSVVSFLKSFGFSHSQIRSAVDVCPQILFANTEKTLGPKLRFFQELGFSGPHFGKFIAKYSSVLTRSLEGSLKPCVETVKKIIGNDENNKYLMRVLGRCSWVLARRTNARILSNILYFKSCGIDDDKLSKLFNKQPRLFAKPESDLRGIIKKLSEIGYPMDSGMLIYAISTVGALSSETIERKLELIRSFGFSKAECMEMFRRQPLLVRTSEVKLRCALEFLLDTVRLKRSRIVHQPICLMHNVEDRLLARYRVVKTLMEKGLLKKQPAFLHVLHLPEEVFLERYISKFTDSIEDLLYSYKGHLLESSTEEEEV